MSLNKGKSKQPYEFGVKVGIASTVRGNLIVGARAFHGNPYDGHTLNEQLEQASILMQDTGVKPTTAFVDLGYRGVDADNPDVHIVHRGKTRRITPEERELLKRRQAIPGAGQEHGQSGDAVCAVQPVDGAQAAVEHGDAGMSASEIGQRAANGAEYAPNMPFERQKMLLSEISTGNDRVSGICANFP